MDCGKVLQSSQLHFQSLDCRNASVQSRYGQTFLPHGDEGILYGGRGLESEIHSDIWSINFQNQSCEKLKPNKEPTGRYFHCGVVYKVSILQKLNCLNGFSLQARNSTFLFDLFTWASVMLKPSYPLFLFLFLHCFYFYFQLYLLHHTDSMVFSPIALVKTSDACNSRFDHCRMFQSFSGQDVYLWRKDKKGGVEWGSPLSL